MVSTTAATGASVIAVADGGGRGGVIRTATGVTSDTSRAATGERKLEPLRVYIAARIGISGAFLMEDVLLSFRVRREDEEDIKKGMLAWMFEHVDVEILASQDMGEI